MDMLKRSLAFHGNKLRKSHEVETLYFGGGTPNLLTVKQLSNIIQTAQKYFTFTQFPEITIEINPEFSNSVEDLSSLKDIGFNRLSIGIQSLNDDELKTLGRIHNANTALSCIKNAKKVFNNISIDIIYAIPGQNKQSLINTITQICDLKPQHISAYNLTAEEGTPYANMLKTGILIAQDESVELEYFYTVHNLLEKNGYHHYEISNYALPDKMSRHNSSYWTDQDYLGIGPSAHSRIGDYRYAFYPELQSFIDDPSHFDEKDVVTESDTLITRLRCSKGLNKQDISSQSWEKLSAYQKAHPNWLVNDNETIKCTLEGWIVLDTILVDVI